MERNTDREADEVTGALHRVAEPDRIAVLSSFFKTGAGEYGCGDVFIGVSVPANRKVAKAFYAVSLDCIGRLLRSEVHEYRLCALLMLVEKYRRAADRKQAESVFDFYVANLDRANNWDLVDLSAPYILGEHVIGTGHSAVLHDLVKSGNMWRRRAAVVSTLTLVRKGHLDEAMCMAAAVMDDAEELLWKAGGWVLREAGKKIGIATALDESLALPCFRRHGIPDIVHSFSTVAAAIMPRVMLRYAIERLPGDLRKHYMSLKNK